MTPVFRGSVHEGKLHLGDREAFDRHLRPPLVIWEAYRRPCFICAKTGECAHREPQVELAYAAAMHAAIGRVVETKVKGAAA